MKSYPLSATTESSPARPSYKVGSRGIRYTLLIIVIAISFSGCGSRYSAERLYWQANHAAEKIIQNKALDKLTTDEYQMIITAYREVIEKYPLEPLVAQSQFIIAQLYLLQDKYSEAQKELLEVTQNFSKKPEIASRAQFMIGNLYERQGDFETAIAEYEKVIELYPTSNLGLRTPIYIAQQYQHNQKDSQAKRAYKRAERNYEKIIDEYSGTSVAPNIMDYLATAYLIQGKWDEAIETWQTIINEYPQSPVTAKSLLVSGEIYAKQIRDLEKAILTYEDFVNQYPNSQVIKQVRLQIGNLYFNKGDTEKAKQVFLEILRDYPEELDLCANARIALASCYEKEGKGIKAIDEYRKLKEDYPDTKLALAVPFFIAQYYLSSELDKNKAEAAFAQAITEYKEIVNGQGNNPLIMEAGRLISLCYIQQQKWNEAINFLYNLVVKHPDKPETQMFLLNIAGIYQRELNEPEKAIKIYDELIRKYPTSHLVNLAKTKLESLQKQEDNSKNYIEN